MKQSTKIEKKQRPKYDPNKKQAVKWVATHIGVSDEYVYGVLRGDFKNGKADEIKKTYAQKYNELQKVLAI